MGSDSRTGSIPVSGTKMVLVIRNPVKDQPLFHRRKLNSAGWSSLVARRAHNPKVVGSNPAPATTCIYDYDDNNFIIVVVYFFYLGFN